MTQHARSELLHCSYGAESSYILLGAVGRLIFSSAGFGHHALTPYTAFTGLGCQQRKQIYRTSCRSRAASAAVRPRGEL